MGLRRVRTVRYMQTILDITVPGNPHPKERPRVLRGRGVTPPKSVAAEKALLGACKPSLGEVTTAEVRVVLHFRRGDRRRCDIDNLVKTVLDALNKQAYADDSQIVELHATLERGCPEPSTRILIETI